MRTLGAVTPVWWRKEGEGKGEAPGDGTGDERVNERQLGSCVSRPGACLAEGEAGAPFVVGGSGLASNPLPTEHRGDLRQVAPDSRSVCPGGLEPFRVTVRNVGGQSEGPGPSNKTSAITRGLNAPVDTWKAPPHNLLSFTDYLKSDLRRDYRRQKQ